MSCGKYSPESCFHTPSAKECLHCPNPVACEMLREDAARAKAQISEDCHWSLTYEDCSSLRKVFGTPCPSLLACQLRFEQEHTRHMDMPQYRAFITAKARRELPS